MAKARPALLGTSLLLLSCFGTTGAPPPAHTFPVRTYTLASGLRIVVEQDDTSRLVGIAWVVGVGHEDDPPPHPGLAHLVEHLLYTAPDATGVSTWRRLIDLGASENAQTDLDLTTAFAFAPRAALDELVEVFLDRVEEPGVGIDEALIAKERHVIDQEVTLRESQGRAGLRLAVDALAGRPLIHDPADVRAALGAITLDDVRGFLATHYRPERMTLILSGPLGDEWDQRFLAMLPPALAGTAAQRRPPVRRPLAAAGRVGRRPEITTALADVRERELWLAWPVAPARGKDVVPMQMLAALADGVLKRQIQSSVISDVSDGSATVLTTSTFGAFLVRLELRPGADPEQVRKEAGDVLELLQALPIADWLQPERRKSELDLQVARLRAAFAMESLEARTLERARVCHDHPEQGIFDVVDAVIDSSIPSVAESAGTLAGPPARSILLTPRPGGRLGLRRAALSELTALGDGDEDRDADEPESPHDAKAVLATAQAPGARAARVSRLGNGLTLIVLPRPGLPVVSMLLGFHGEPQSAEDPSVRPAISIARKFNLMQGPLDLAILQRGHVEPGQYLDTLEMFASSAPKAIELLGDESSRVRLEWPSSEGEAWLQKAALREATVDAHLTRSLRAALFKGHPYRLDTLTSGVRATSADALHGWLDRVRRPANGALVIVGDVDGTAIAAAAGDATSGWSADAAPPPAPPLPPVVAATPPQSPQVLAAIDPSRAWTKVEFGCFLPPASSARDSVAGELVADALGDELFRRLRIDRAASYAPSLTREVLRGGTHVLTGVLDVDPKAGPAARDLLREWLDPTSGAVLDPGAIEKARWRAARRSGLRDATNAALARRLFEAWNQGWPLESLDDYPRDLASLTPAEVAAALTSCRTSAVIAVLAPP